MYHVLATLDVAEVETDSDELKKAREEDESSFISQKVQAKTIKVVLLDGVVTLKDSERQRINDRMLDGKTLKLTKEQLGKVLRYEWCPEAYNVLKMKVRGDGGKEWKIEHFPHISSSEVTLRSLYKRTDLLDIALLKKVLPEWIYNDYNFRDIAVKILSLHRPSVRCITDPKAEVIWDQVDLERTNSAQPAEELVRRVILSRKYWTTMKRYDGKLIPMGYSVGEKIYSEEIIADMDHPRRFAYPCLAYSSRNYNLITIYGKSVISGTGGDQDAIDGKDHRAAGEN